MPTDAKIAAEVRDEIIERHSEEEEEEAEEIPLAKDLLDGCYCEASKKGSPVSGTP